MEGKHRATGKEVWRTVGGSAQAGDHIVASSDVATPQKARAFAKLREGVVTGAGAPADPTQTAWRRELCELRRLERELRERVLITPEAQRLIWVPGIGKMVAYTLLLEIDDIHRFPTGRHFHSYCRLVPGSSDSGGKTRHKRSRDGNRYLKIALHHAAIRAIQYFAEIRIEYQLLHRRKGKPIARALIAKELATIVYALLTKGVDFNGTFRGHPLTRTKKHTWPRLASPPCLTEALKASFV